MWGQVRRPPNNQRSYRIIPTRVGTSVFWLDIVLRYQDHPHACGDKMTLFCKVIIMSGSSPRVWGQETAGISSACSLGIIPTRVGTRTAYSLMSRAWEDHPHACGDKYARADVAGERRGSSPRVWGQASPVKRKSAIVGIIPTRVGTSVCCHRTIACVRDHPHACGDKTVSVIRVLSMLGSSPRVWGQVSFAVAFFDSLRIIPTRVGTRENNQSHKITS